MYVRNRFQPQTSLWNYEKAMLIKIVALFRNLLISTFDATIRVKRAFVYFETQSSNDCVVTAMRGMRLIDRQRKKTCHPLLSLIRRINQTTLPAKWLFPEWFIVCAAFVLDYNYFSAVATENSCPSTLCLAYDFFVNFLTLWRNSLQEHHPTPRKFPSISPPPPRNFHWPTVGGGGGMYIFWNCTLQIWFFWVQACNCGRSFFVGVLFWS